MVYITVIARAIGEIRFVCLIVIIIAMTLKSYKGECDGRIHKKCLE